MKQAKPIKRFAKAARAFCGWATSGPAEATGQAIAAAQLVADLLAAGCALGAEEGEPAIGEVHPDELKRVTETAAALPFQYYSEVFSNLVVPPEEPVVGDIVDDMEDIYRDVSIGLVLFDQGRKGKAAKHWRFWFVHHWGEHATSALRALWSYVADRRRCDGPEWPRDA